MDLPHKSIVFGDGLDVRITQFVTEQGISPAAGAVLAYILNYGKLISSGTYTEQALKDFLTSQLSDQQAFSMSSVRELRVRDFNEQNSNNIIMRRSKFAFLDFATLFECTDAQADMIRHFYTTLLVCQDPNRSLRTMVIDAFRSQYGFE